MLQRIKRPKQYSKNTFGGTCGYHPHEWARKPSSVDGALPALERIGVMYGGGMTTVLGIAATLI